MRLPETRDLIVKSVEFPATCDEVIEAIGDESLDTPQGGAESIADVLERCGEEEFRSVDELFDSIAGSVAAGHVGRRGYDDRGPNLGGEDEVSF